MPDHTISIDDRNSYSYTADELLPLSKERAIELWEQDLTVYLLYEDNTEAMAFDREDIDAHSGLFGIEKADWLENITPPSIAEPHPTLTNTEQADTLEFVAEITQEDIEAALLHWNGDKDSKARVLSYMQHHSRERGTAEWLKNEYGGDFPTFPVTKGDLSLELPWAKVQRHIGQLVEKGEFFSHAEIDRPRLNLP